MIKGTIVLLSDSVAPHREHNKYQVYSVKKGISFKSKGISLSPDHSTISIIPSECHENEIEYWTKCDDGKVLCHCPDDIENVKIDDIDSVHFRNKDKDYYDYHFFKVDSLYDYFKKLFEAYQFLFKH